MPLARGAGWQVGRAQRKAAAAGATIVMNISTPDDAASFAAVSVPRSRRR